MRSLRRIGNYIIFGSLFLLRQDCFHALQPSERRQNACVSAGPHWQPTYSRRYQTKKQGSSDSTIKSTQQSIVKIRFAGEVCFELCRVSVRALSSHVPIDLQFSTELELHREDVASEFKDAAIAVSLV